MKRCGYLLGVFLLTSWSCLTTAGESIACGQPVVATSEGLESLDSRTSERRWKVLGGIRLRGPAVAGKVMLVTGNADLLAIDACSGELLWRQPLGSPGFAPVVAEGRVLVATHSGALRAFSLPQGEPLWRVNSAGGWVYPPAVAGGLLITGGQAGRLTAIDIDSGRQQWAKQLAQELVYRPVSVGRGDVVVTTFSGAIQRLRGADGSELWRARFPTPSRSPTVGGGRLYSWSMGGIVRALKAATGDLLWEYPTTAAPALPLVVNGAGLLLVTDERQYHFLSAEDGRAMGSGVLAGEPVAVEMLGSSSARIYLQTGKKRKLQPVVIVANE